MIRRNHAVWVMVLTTFLWATAGVVTRHLDAARSFEVTFWRSCFTALSLLVILPWMRGRRVFADMLRAGPAFWFSGFCWGVMFTSFMISLKDRTTASDENCSISLR